MFYLIMTIIQYKEKDDKVSYYGSQIISFNASED